MSNTMEIIRLLCIAVDVIMATVYLWKEDYAKATFWVSLIILSKI